MLEKYNILTNPIINFSVSNLKGTIIGARIDNIENIKKIVVITADLYFLLYDDNDNSIIDKNNCNITDLFTDLYLDRISKCNFRLQFSLKENIETNLYIIYDPNKTYPFLSTSKNIILVKKYDNLNSNELKKTIVLISKNKKLLVYDNDTFINPGRSQDNIYYYKCSNNSKILNKDDKDIIDAFYLTIVTFNDGKLVNFYL